MLANTCNWKSSMQKVAKSTGQERIQEPEQVKRESKNINSDIKCLQVYEW